jgi:FlaA1/EpsC-like NDP-sugar epimerase
MGALLGTLRKRRLWVLAGLDSLVWVVSMVGYAWLTYPDPGAVPLGVALGLGAAAAGCHLVLGRTVRLHHGRATTGSVEDLLLLGAVTAGAGSLAALLNTFLDQELAWRVPFGGTFIALTAMAWARVAYRHSQEPPAEVHDGQEPVLIIGAGDGGRQLISSMLGRRDGVWVPVALLDDDPLKAHLRIRGVPVVGTTVRLASVAQRYGVRTVIVAIPTASAERIRELSREAMAADLDLKVLPPRNELVSPFVDVSDVRDIDVTDLLGRRQIDTDVAAVAGYLTGQRVLVTGAGGSIGSEICRQVHRFGPAELMLLDRDESALHALQLDLYGNALVDCGDIVLGDIRDARFVEDLFARRRPQVVFHAAALKHPAMMEEHPGEAVKTNVWGTLTVLEAARAHGVETFVNISTDKAADPIGALGWSKRLGESLTAAVAAGAGGNYLSVRFGNVLASRGSVLTVFASQIARGGPVTITHPEITRFFMTVQEAVQLVIQAGAIGHHGEALVLDMGEPVSIEAVARHLIELSGRPIEIVHTGLRQGEKLHEELFAAGESTEPTVHPLVSRTRVPALDPLVARDVDPWGPPEQVAAWMRDLCASLSPAHREVVS